MKKIFDETAFAQAKSVSFAKASPDESKILYGVSGFDYENDKGLGWLWLFDLAKNTSRQLTFDGESGSGDWLDDGTVFFTGLRGKAIKEAVEAKDPFTVFYALPIDGGEARELFRVPVAGASALVIDSDRFLIFGLYDAGEHKEERELVTIYDEYPYHCNDDAFGMTNKRRNRIWLYTLSKDKLEPITSELFHAQQRLRFGYQPFLSKDRKRLYFVGEEFTSHMNRTQPVWVYDVETKKVRKLFDNDRYLLIDGFEFKNRVWFVGTSATLEFCSTDLISVDKAGGSYRIEAQPQPSLHYALVDGDRILTASGDREKTPICAYQDKQFTTIAEPHIKVESRLFKAGGRLFYVGREAIGVRQLSEIVDNKAVALTDVGRDYLKSYSFQKPKAMIAKSPHGEVQGWVIKPHESKPDQSYPAILCIHGGPQSAYSDSLDPYMQHFAAHGYYVFFCNPHGSSNYGREFMDIDDKYGTIDFDDIMAFTDAVLAKYPMIDPKRLGVTGGSYGGYMTNWVIGHTERFGAAVSMVSISNWISMFGTTDVAFFVQDGQKGNPWDHPENMWEHSPLKYIDKVKTPTLFCQNNEDYRCPVEQAEQMLTSMLIRGVDAKMLLFHKASHGRMTPKQTAIRMREALAWFDKYLG